MANFSVVGLESWSADMAAVAALPDGVAGRMLDAGCGVLEKAQKAEAASLGIKDTGDFISSNKRAKMKADTNGSRTKDVYPQGKDRKGIRNAEKGFIAEYGTSKQPARPWMRRANQKSETAVQNAMEAVYDDYIQKSGG